MEGTGFISSIILLIFLAGIVFFEIHISKVLEEKRRIKFPNYKSFKWGYFWGLTGIIGPIIISIGILIAPGTTYLYKFFALLISIIIIVIPSYFVIKRKKWAWAFTTIISMNLVFWIINYYYFRNREDELE